MSVHPDSMQTLPRRVLRAISADADWFSSWTPPIALLILTVLLLVWYVVRMARRRRAWPILPAILLSLALTVAAGANTISGYVPSVSSAEVLLGGLTSGTSARGKGHVSSIEIPVPAARRLGTSSTYVYTPPGYRSGQRRYPVLYLIHGTPGTSSDWVVAGSIANTMDALINSNLAPPMIVVAPDANAPDTDDTECLDSTRPGGPQVATYLDHDVVGYIDSHYRSIADRAHRAIGGFSMGGYCAVDRGMRSAVYGSIMAIAPYDNPGSGGRNMVSTQRDYEAASPGRYLEPGNAVSLPVTADNVTTAVFLDTGADVEAAELAQIRHLAELFSRRGQPLQYRLEPGGDHSWTTARVAAAYGIVFVGKHFPSE